MTRFLIFSFALLMTSPVLNAQNMDSRLTKNKMFSGAESVKDSYHAIFQLDSNDPKKIAKAIRNMNNALDDPRLEGKLTIELIAFSGGTDAYLKGSQFEKDLQNLVKKGVIIAQCHNTLVERQIKPESLFDPIAIVPSGTGELILRQAQGWAIIKP